ncbi:MAG: NERD domain-containing protein [Actinomycetota bacterium]|nr:NERD domain-containing protein [Actinomycetota bacterium]
MDRPLGTGVVERTNTLAGRPHSSGGATEGGEGRRGPWFGAFVSLLAATHRHRDDLARRAGATGDRVVGFVLGRLPEGWHVFRGTRPAGLTAAVDHVVVGPAGVFAVHTKNLAGKVWVAPGMIRHNGHPTDYLRQVATDARRASSLLAAAGGRPVDVRGVVAILADGWTITQSPADIHVGSPRAVRDWLLRLPPTLSPRDVMRIAGIAGAPSTWTPSASA